MKREYKIIKLGVVELFKGVDFDEKVNGYMNKTGSIGWDQYRLLIRMKI